MPEKFSPTDILHDKVDTGWILKASEHANHERVIQNFEDFPLCFQMLHLQIHSNISPWNVDATLRKQSVPCCIA